MTEAEDNDAGEIADAFKEQYGGFWLGYEPGKCLPNHQLIAGFDRANAGRHVLTSLILRGAPITSDDLRRVPVKELENTATVSNGLGRKELAASLRKLPRLVRESAKSPEEFSQLVARHYELWSSLVPHPAPAIAEANDVKVATVHTWIREARLRGLITTGTRRKASRLGDS